MTRRWRRVRPQRPGARNSSSSGHMRVGDQGRAMSRNFRHVGIMMSSLVLAVVTARAQGPQTTESADKPPTWISDIKFVSGREVVPYLEGWIKNPDGTFDFVFGYYNRNQEQDLV